MYANSCTVYLMDSVFCECVCVVSLLLFVLLVNRFLCSHLAVLHSISHKSSNCKCFFHVHAFLVMFSISNKANKSLHNSNVEPHWKAECKTYYASDQTTIQFTKHICELRWTWMEERLSENIVACTHVFNSCVAEKSCHCFKDKKQ